MPKDRIDQLRATSSQGQNNKKQKSVTQPEENEEEEEDETTALTIQRNESVIIRIKNKDNNELESVYKHVNTINEGIAQIQEDVVQLKRYHVRMQQSTRADPSLREQIDSLNETIKRTAMKIKSSLKELEKEKKGEEEGVINRVVKTQHSLLTKRFRETMEDYEQSLSAHKKICEDIIRKQLHIVIEWIEIRKMTCVPAEREVTDEELSSILDSEDIAIFVDNYTKETLEARQSLEDARDRHREIIKLEKDILLIRELIYSIALQVTQQGELIDRIEYHIGNGYVMTQKGHKRLSKAQKLMMKARKKKVWIILFLTSVIAICLLILFV